jgi:membrane protease YdiL (CAAX protease family)
VNGATRAYWPIVEGLIVLTVTLIITTGLRLPTLWFLVPLVVITVSRRPYEEYGLTLRNPGGILFHAVVSLAAFLPYAFGHYLWEYWNAGAVFDLRLPPDLMSDIIDQTFIVALPEEFFFRGYLQTQFDKTLCRPYKFLRADIGLGLPIAAAVFALCHVPFGGPARMIVFFPGLLYGWLRARTDTIVVPTLYHAASNVLMKVMIASLMQHQMA